MTPTAQTPKGETDELDVTKTNRVCASEGTVWKAESQPAAWEGFLQITRLLRAVGLTCVRNSTTLRKDSAVKWGRGHEQTAVCSRRLGVACQGGASPATGVHRVTPSGVAVISKRSGDKCWRRRGAVSPSLLRHRQRQGRTATVGDGAVPRRARVGAACRLSDPLPRCCGLPGRAGRRRGLRPASPGLRPVRRLCPSARLGGGVLSDRGGGWFPL